MSIDISTRSRRSRPIGASIVPERASGRARPQRQVLAAQTPRAPAAPSARDAPRRSWPRPAAPRCRGRGDGRCPAARLIAPGDASGQRLRQRARPMAARRVHDNSGRLVHHQQVLVLVGNGERGLARLDASAPRASSTSIRSPTRTPWRLGRTRPSTRTRSASIRLCACAREPSGSARKRSSRVPPASCRDLERRRALTCRLDSSRAGPRAPTAARGRRT